MEVRAKELTVCDIIGDWGLYQWSVTLFAMLYSALAGMVVVVGPLWTPDMAHLCSSSSSNQVMANSELSGSSELNGSLVFDFSSRPHQCFSAAAELSQATLVGAADQQAANNLTSASSECLSFVYDSQNYGKMLTNSFDLVCSHQWLRSFPSSSALAGMLLSSVTLGLLSDKYGRMSCVQTGFVIAILATTSAVLVNNYFLLNLCFMFMSYAQIGVANALCTLVMESTSPRWRFVPVFQYGFGWGLGMLITPLLNQLTRNYQHFLLVLLACQLLMTVWLRFGVFESIRWLLSEGHINRAQIELQRACRINRVANGAELAQKIAQMQVQQVRKASTIISTKTNPMRLSTADQQMVATAAQELSILGDALRSSFGVGSSLPAVAPEHQADGRRYTVADGNTLESTLSPTLARKSFSLTDHQVLSVPANNQVNQPLSEAEQVIFGQLEPRARQSITTQCLIQLALKYSKTLQEQDEGTFFLVQMFHRKLYKTSILLILLSVMLETTYYGLIQVNGFVGDDANLNYMTGALSEFMAAAIYLLMLWLFSRRVALIAPVMMGSLVCLGIALAYQLVPGPMIPGGHWHVVNVTASDDQVDAFISRDNMTSAAPQSGLDYADELLQLRETTNFWLMNFGKLAITVGIQVAATVTMESYPNNLRQTACGAIVLVGRLGSVLAPFLFNDHSAKKSVFKITLTCLGAFGMLTCVLIPFFLRDNKGKELCDRLNEIDDDDDDDVVADEDAVDNKEIARYLTKTTTTIIGNETNGQV